LFSVAGGKGIKPFLIRKKKMIFFSLSPVTVFKERFLVSVTGRQR
jgi:hypothetical protein